MSGIKQDPVLTRRRLILGIAAASIAGTPAPTWADRRLEVDDDVRVEGATATAAGSNGISRLAFTLINDGGRRLHLSRIVSKVAQHARLMAQIGVGMTSEIGSVGVSPGEELDLSSSHMWYELSGLMRALTLDETFDVELDFVDFQISIPVHVHPARSGT